MTASLPRVGVVDPMVLYADLRDRLAPRVELVDLSTMQSDQPQSLHDLDVVLHHPRLQLQDAAMSSDRLRAVLAPGAGYDGIPIPAATAAGILVTNQAGCNDEAVAEHAIGLLLAVAKRIGEGDRQIRSGRGWRAAMFFNHEIRGLTLGIIGLGAIGRRLATIARLGFDMRVLAHDPYLEGGVEGVELVTFDGLLSDSDVVSVNAPLTDTTRGLIGSAELARMRPGSILVNTARGYIVDVDAVADAVASGHLRGAGLDVFDDDVLEQDHPILQLDAVVVTPHIAGATYESLESQAVRQADAVFSALDGKVPTSANVLNPDVIERFLERVERSTVEEV
jgi:D-3-phosphoglycerate dehydrogenase